MKRVHEFEAWSTRGKLLPPDYGKQLAQELWQLGIPKDVYLGLSSIPDQSDVENLALALEAREISLDDFKGFCEEHSLDSNITSAESACKFLEYSFGRRLAWIHIPEDGVAEVLEEIIELLSERGHIVVDPDD